LEIKNKEKSRQKYVPKYTLKNYKELQKEGGLGTDFTTDPTNEPDDQKVTLKNKIIHYYK
jgi:hypothetical protein